MKLHPEDRLAAISELSKSLPDTSDRSKEVFKSNYVGATKQPMPCSIPNCPICR